MATITIDCGASFIKGAVFENNQICKQVEKRAPKAAKNGIEKEPVQLPNLVRLFNETIEELSAEYEEVKLCISNEMHGFVLTGADGKLISDYISWQNESGRKYMDEVREYPEEIRHSGMPLRAGLPSSNLHYMEREGYLGAYSKIYFYTLGDYLIHETFQIAPICHASNAAATGLFDLTKNEWNLEFVNKLVHTKVVFPTVGTEAQTVTKNNKSFQVYPALGDQQAALLGAGVTSEGDISFNLGTGAQVSCLTKTPDFSDLYQIRPYFKGYYLKTIPHIPSGRALNVYIGFFKSVLQAFGVEPDEKEIWEHILKEAETCPMGTLDVDLSFFENPFTKHTVGSIGNITETNLNVADLMSSILMQVANNCLEAEKTICPEAESRMRLVFSGGVARKISLIRDLIISENIEAEVVVAENETLLGLNQFGNED